MALRLIDQYPGQVAPVDANYPHGAPRNVSAPSAGDGTPWEEAWVKDIYGFLSALIDDAGITHSGTADTSPSSQYLQALKTVLLQRSELASQGGTIVENTNKLRALDRHGLRVIRDSTVLMTTEPGGARNPADDADLILAANLQKNITVTWALGNGLGGLPAALVPLAANQMLRRFIVKTPGGTVDLCWDSSPVAANFFLDANAIAAGFSDATLYRRYGWTHVDSGSLMTDHVNLALDPTSYLWVTPPPSVPLAGLTTANRVAVNYGDEVPPSCIGVFSFLVNTDAGANKYVYLSHADQADVAASATNFTFFKAETAGKDFMSGVIQFPVDSNQDLFARLFGGTHDSSATTVHGWIDPGLVA